MSCRSSRIDRNIHYFRVDTGININLVSEMELFEIETPSKILLCHNVNRCNYTNIYVYETELCRRVYALCETVHVNEPPNSINIVKYMFIETINDFCIM